MRVPLENVHPQHHPQKSCDGCPNQGPQVGTSGDPTAAIVIVTESPTFEDLKTAKPMSGPAGSVFKGNIPKDIPIYVIHAMECNPILATKDDDTMRQATNACNGNLIAKIRAHPRKIIITLGNWATRSVLGIPDIKITQTRGKIIESNLAAVGVMPIVHMGALMMGTGSYRQWQNDLAYAIDLGMGGKIKEYIQAKEIKIPFCVAPAYVDSLFDTFSDHLSNDLETSSLDYRTGYILQSGVTDDVDPSIAYVFGPPHIQMLKKHLENRRFKWAFHNGKFDVEWYQILGIDAVVSDDTMLMSYTLNEEGGIHGLETVAADLLGAPDYKDVLKPWLPNKKTSYAAVPYDVLAAYLADDCGRTSQIRTIYRERIRRDAPLEKLYTETLIPASAYLAWVETNGAYIDTDKLAANEQFYDNELNIHRSKICELAGYTINPGSFKQVAELLYDKMRYPNRWKRGTGEEIIKKLLEIKYHPILEHILLYRKASKMNGTYVKGWHKFISNNGRIHCTYKIHGTRTGRLSSANPNMQNIPRLARIKDQVCASPGYELVEVDFSQAELRILAALSKDPILCELFKSGADPHTDLANYLFPGWDDRNRIATETGDEELTAQCKEQRVKCKNVNFGIIYGITCFGLAEQIKDTPEAAQAMLDGWASRYAVAQAFINSCRAAPLTNKIMETSFGRRKRVGIVNRMNMMFLQNEAANFPPQSIASDLTLTAGIRTWKQLRDWGCRIINTVHDSIIFEVPIMNDGGELRHRAITLVCNMMKALPAEYKVDAVPFEVEAEIGTHWGSLKKYDMELAA